MKTKVLWHEVTEKLDDLPKVGDIVLCRLDDGAYTVCEFVGIEDIIHKDNQDVFFTSPLWATTFSNFVVTWEVTHWLEIPEIAEHEKG